MANPRGQQRDKPFRDALRMEIAEAGDNFRLLRKVAQAHIAKALSGDMAAIKELADRIDGRVPQAIVGDDEHPPVVTAFAEWLAWMKSPEGTGPGLSSGPITNGHNDSPKSSPTDDAAKQ